MKKILLSFTAIVFAVNSYSQWTQAGAGAGSVNDLIVYNNMLVGGGTGFVNANLGIAQWNGSSWQSFGYGIDSGGYVNCFDTLNSTLYAAGLFSLMDSVPVNNIAIWNGTSWSDVGGGTNGVIVCMAFYGGELYAGGQFTMAGSTPVNNIARWNGTSWSAVGVGVTGTIIPHVHSLCVYNNELYAGGSFTSPANYIAKWNGSSWSAVGAGVDDQVNALHVYNNELYAGGYFDHADNITVPGFSKWNGSWSFVSQCQILILTMSTFNGNLFLGGGGAPGNSFMEWNGSVMTSIPTGIPSASSAFIVHGIYAIEKYGNDIFLGGFFLQGWNEPGDCIIYAPQTIGINESENPFAAAIFPNPSNGKFTISSTGNVTFLVITDVFGKTIYTTENLAASVEINLTGISPGIYFIRTSGGKTTQTQKIIITQ
ncbi:MAG: T9SS type A sorting domain-containing protein [Bacteroidota bacterium]|nr:T9SS type A sorting domain-containing protein [Bacteroidota bacterium]